MALTAGPSGSSQTAAADASVEQFFSLGAEQGGCSELKVVAESGVDVFVHIPGLHGTDRDVATGQFAKVTAGTTEYFTYGQDNIREAYTIQAGQVMSWGITGVKTPIPV